MQRHPTFVRWCVRGVGLFAMVFGPCSVASADGGDGDAPLDLGHSTVRLQPEPPGQPDVLQPGAEHNTTSPSSHDLFFSKDDGALDVSEFLSSKTGFLPLAMPITEPAVGYGLAIGAAYFHNQPKVLPAGEDGRARVLWPSMTVLLGAATENGTWAGALAHIGIWDEGRIRYTGAAGYANLNLDWFGKGDSLGGDSVSYTNQEFFFIQTIRFKLGESDFFLGPSYRFFSSDTSFSGAVAPSGIPEGDLQSRTSGAGFQFSYDSLDHPFSPSSGVHADLSASQQATWLGGDFNYTKIQSYAMAYFPLREKMVLGARLNGDFIAGEAPFYDLPGINIRGLARAKYVDNSAVYGEAELRYDVTKRWSAIGFAGAGQVGSTLSDFFNSPIHAAGGGGFRYLIAESYGMRIGADLAYGDGGPTLYISVGTGWIRP